MKLEAVNVKTKYAFCRNPIRIIAKDSSEADKNLLFPSGAPYSVEINGTTVFKGIYFPPFDVNLADVAEAYVSAWPEPEKSPAVFKKIRSMDELPAMSVKVTGADSIVRKIDLTLLPGGISKRNWRRLCSLDTDMFECRLLDRSANSFLSVRAGSWRIVIRETELAPLCFIIDEEQTVSVRDTFSGCEYSAVLSSGIWALDVSELRLKIAREQNVLSSSFDIYRDNGNGSMKRACQVVIEEAQCTRDSVLVKFRNSYGVFELIDLTGTIEIEKTSDDTDSETNRYDSLVDAFESIRTRSFWGNTFTVNSGFRKLDDIVLIDDMIASDEVYLMITDEYPIKVVPSVEDYVRPMRSEKPFSMTMKFRVTDAEGNMTPEIISRREFSHVGVFSKEFSKEFN